jgi:hypothetical protein
LFYLSPWAVIDDDNAIMTFIARDKAAHAMRGKKLIIGPESPNLSVMGTSWRKELDELDLRIIDQLAAHDPNISLL